MKSLVYLLLFVGGLGDLVTTLYGLSIGLVETRPLFPFAATTIFCACVWLINREWLQAPQKLKNIAKELFVAVAFSPVLWNSFMIIWRVA